jgi:hypothetical protein
MQKRGGIILHMNVTAHVLLTVLSFVRRMLIIVHFINIYKTTRRAAGDIEYMEESNSKIHECARPCANDQHFILLTLATYRHAQSTLLTDRFIFWDKVQVAVDQKSPL